MIHDRIEFHNVVELVDVEGVEGLRLQRAPESVRKQIDEGTAGVMMSPANSEIRFRLADGYDSTTVRLSSKDGATVYVFHGPFQGTSLVVGAEPQDISITRHKRLVELTKADCPDAQFDPHLIRLVFGGDYPEPVMYHGHGEGVLPPRDGDVPEKVYLAYGSSIAHGTGLSGAALSYPAHVAWKLGYDLRNLGASGCCLCEKAMADFIAEQACNLVTLELSVNMLGRGLTADEFRERAAYLVEQVADSDQARPVVCITLFPHYHDIHERYDTPEVNATSREYRQVLRDIVSDLARPNLYIVEGPELLSDLGGLSHDLIHPGVRGMIQIAEELARRIRAEVL